MSKIGWAAMAIAVIGLGASHSHAQVDGPQKAPETKPDPKPTPAPPAAKPQPAPRSNPAPSQPEPQAQPQPQLPTFDHDELVKRAHGLALSNKRQWIRLGHWQESVFGGWESQADGLDFFLADDGKSNPRAELEATIRSVFVPGARDDKHPSCRFPARMIFLGTQLGVNVGPLLIGCKGFFDFTNEVRAKSVTLIFSSYYLRKAASAFGHTFFRIEKHEPLATTEKRQLIDTGIDYSATVTVKNPMLYAIMGLTGQFKGTFRKMPYYYKVREYNDYESRDLWEYSLNLTDEQLAMFVSHIWELGHTYFDYWYLTENCGYHILGALEAANPDLELLSHVKTPSIPGDTIKALYANEGLVKEVNYRPSLHTQFEARLRTLNKEQRKHLEKLVEDPEHMLPGHMEEAARIRIFDASVDLIDLRHARELLSDLESQPAKYKRRILERRSQIHQPSEELAITPPWSKMPQLGHGSRRLRLGGGSIQGQGAYATAELRIGMHDIGDAPAGYPEFSGLEFFRLSTRYSLADSDFTTGDFSIENFSVMSITNLIPLDRFTTGATWQLDIGGSRIYDDACEDCFAFHTKLAGGATLPLFGGKLALYGMVESIAAVGPSLDGIRGTPIRLGFGPTAGLRAKLSANAIFLASGEWLWLPVQDPFATWQANATFRWKLSKSFALDANGTSRDGHFGGQLSGLLYY